MNSPQLLPRAGYRFALRFLVERSLRVVVSFFFVCVTPTFSVAAVRYWVPATGGAFHSSAHWSASSSATTGGASVPGAADVATFNKSTLSVTFSANVTNAGLNIGASTATFDLNGNMYTVTGSAGTTIGTVASQAGRLTLKNGTFGVDTANDQINVGTASATGFLTVSTGGQLGNGSIEPNLVVGDEGTGTFSIEDHGRADLGFLVLGRVANATGTATISGPNTVLDASGAINVGSAGNGTVNVQNGGSVSNSQVSIGSQLGANGTPQ